MESPDREERKEAFLAWAKLYEGISEKLDTQYDKLIKVRIRMAKKLGLPDYTTLGYLNMPRSDCGTAEVARFREQVRRVIVPAVAKLREEQAKRLGVEKLKYYRITSYNVCYTKLLRYKKTTAACKTTFRGKEVNFYGLLKHMESPDREERKEAFLAWAKLV